MREEVSPPLLASLYLLTECKKKGEDNNEYQDGFNFISINIRINNKCSLTQVM
jgi:hypothetical protein